MQTYGIDLLDLYRDKLSLRKLLLFAVRLPKTSHLMQAIGQSEHGEAVRWNEDTYFLADCANNLRLANYLFQMKMYLQNDKKGQEPKMPDMIHEPGYEEPKAEFAKEDQLLAMFRGNIGF